MVDETGRTPRPGAAAAGAGAEGGTAGGDERRRALAALKAMRERGLMSAEAYERRRREIEAGG